MKISNRVYRLGARKSETWIEAVSVLLSGRLESGQYPLRLSLVQAGEHEVIIESTVLEFEGNEKYACRLSEPELFSPRKKSFQASSFGVVQVVPTGIRCELGGFAGDACPATNLIALAADFVVTHPNAVNASELNEMADNVLYVEGKSLDDFLLGHLGLLRVRSNKVGTFVDPRGEAYVRDVVHTLNAARAVKGIDCMAYLVLREEPGVEIAWTETGCAAGTVLRPEAILDGVEVLLSNGAEAVGGVSVIHGVTGEMFSKHLRGEIPNPSGGVEAVITHLVSKVFRVPAAHAPLPYYQDIKERDTFNPRASAEFISTPHYYSVLKGLARAPRLVPIPGTADAPSHLVTLNAIGAIVMPAGCLGGIPALVAEFNDIPLIAVRENKSILDVTQERMRMRNVIQVNSYLEAAGAILALREGISLESLRRPLHDSRKLDLSGDLSTGTPRKYPDPTHRGSAGSVPR